MSPQPETVLRIEIPTLWPRGLNPNAGKMWNVNMVNRLTQEAHDDVIARIREQMPLGKPLEHARVTVTFVVPDNRGRDHDNLIAGAKAWLDGLTLAGVIKDDSWQHVNLVWPDIVYQKGVRKTIITVEAA